MDEEKTWMGISPSIQRHWSTLREPCDTRQAVVPGFVLQ